MQEREEVLKGSEEKLALSSPQLPLSAMEAVCRTFADLKRLLGFRYIHGVVILTHTCSVLVSGKEPSWCV